jgi:hypothetical protein
MPKADVDFQASLVHPMRRVGDRYGQIRGVSCRLLQKIHHVDSELRASKRLD